MEITTTLSKKCLILALAALGLSGIVPGIVQANARPNATVTPFTMTQAQRLKVGVDPVMPAEEKAIIQQVINDWNQAGCIHLVYDPAYTAHDQILIHNTIIPSESHNNSIVYGLTTIGQKTKQGYLKQAQIELDVQNIRHDAGHVGISPQQYTTAGAQQARFMQVVVAHEIGHALGLKHDNTNNPSVMHSGSSDYISSKDLMRVQNIYQGSN